MNRKRTVPRAVMDIRCEPHERDEIDAAAEAAGVSRNTWAVWAMVWMAKSQAAMRRPPKIIDGGYTAGGVGEWTVGITTWQAQAEANARKEQDAHLASVAAGRIHGEGV